MPSINPMPLGRHKWVNMKRIKNIEIKFINKGKLKHEDYKEKIREERTN